MPEELPKVSRLLAMVAGFICQVPNSKRAVLPTRSSTRRRAAASIIFAEIQVDRFWTRAIALALSREMNPGSTLVDGSRVFKIKRNPQSRSSPAGVNPLPFPPGSSWLFRNHQGFFPAFPYGAARPPSVCSAAQVPVVPHDSKGHPQYGSMNPDGLVDSAGGTG